MLNTEEYPWIVARRAARRRATLHRHIRLLARDAVVTFLVGCAFWYAVVRLAFPVPFLLP